MDITANLLIIILVTNWMDIVTNIVVIIKSNFPNYIEGRFYIATLIYSKYR